MWVNYKISISIWKILNILVNAIFLFFINGLIYLLTYFFADTLLCKLGVWGLLRTPEAVTLLTVKYAFSHFSWYFLLKNLTYIHVCTYTKYISILSFWVFWQICSLKLVYFADTLVCKPGVWGPLGAPEVVTEFYLKMCIFLLYSDFFRAFIQNSH